MHRRRARAAHALTCGAAALAALAASTAGPAAGAAAAEPGSYYTTKGSTGLDVGRYALDLTWKAGSRTLSGTATLRLQVAAAAAALTLDLHRRMEVDSVTVNGVRTRFTHEDHDLVVRTPVLPGTPYVVEVAYAGRPKTVKAPTSRADDDGVGWHTTRTGQAWTTQKPFGAYTWYPVNDHPSDKAHYEIQLRVPDKFVGVSNGRLEDRHTKDGQTVTRWTSGSPTAAYAVTVAIGPYRRYTQVGPHDLPLTYWLPRGGKDLLGPLLKTPDTLAFLESRLGPYPFDRAGVIVTPGLASAETQTLVTLARDNWRQGSADVREQVAHLLAHAWYGNAVTPNDWRDNWMGESVATFLQAKFSVAQGYAGWTFWKREFARNDDFYREIYGPPGAFFPKHFDQRNVQYGGALMLERLRARIGTETFYAALAEWPALHKDRSRGRSTFIEHLSARSGQDLRPWFDAWLTSPTTPTS